MREEAIRRADEALRQAIESRIAAGNEEAVLALRKLVAWKPECGFPTNVSPAYFVPSVPGALAEETDYRKENNLDGTELPFCCESYTYALWGKEDARTFLGLVDAIALALGFRMGIGDPAFREPPEEER